MKEIRVFVIDFDNILGRFSREFEILKGRWVKDKDKFSCNFIPISIPNIYGGTYSIKCNDSNLIKQITDDIKRLLKDWPQFTLDVRDG